jgi:hypothetical protein
MGLSKPQKKFVKQVLTSAYELVEGSDDVVENNVTVKEHVQALTKIDHITTKYVTGLVISEFYEKKGRASEVCGPHKRRRETLSEEEGRKQVRVFPGLKRIRLTDTNRTLCTSCNWQQHVSLIFTLKLQRFRSCVSELPFQK